MAYLVLQKRFSFQTQLRINVVSCLLAFLLLRAALVVGDARLTAGALLVWYDVLFALANLAFWPLAGRLFNIRQAKRLYGLTGSGELLAGILGGFSVPILVNWVATEDLLFGCVVALLGSLLALGAILQSESQQAAADDDDHAESPRSPASADYVRLICAATAVSYFTYFIVDKAFFDQAQQRFDDSAKLASFLGVFFGIVEFAKYLGRLFVTGRFLDRFGARGGLIAMPIVIGTTAVLALGVSLLPSLAVILFWMICGSKLLERFMRFAIDRPAGLVLYQPLAVRRRISVQTTAESIVGPIFGGLSALTLLAIGWFWPGPQALQLLLVPISVVWIWIGWRLGRGYVEVLGDVLAHKRSRSRQRQAENFTGAAAELAKYLQSPTASVVLHAITLLEDWEPDALDPWLPRLLDHADPRVRSDALRLIEFRRPEAAEADVRRLLAGESDATVQGAAVCVLASLLPAKALAGLREYLTHESPDVRSGCAIGMLRRQDHNGLDEARQVPLNMSRSASATERRWAARIIVATRDPQLAEALSELLSDPDPAVRSEALAAVPAYPRPRNWSLLVSSLADPASESAAAACLRDTGHHFMNYWVNAFHDPQQPTRAKVKLVQIMDGFPDEVTLEQLIALLKVPDTAVRHAALGVLARRREMLQGRLQVQGRQWLDREVRRGAWVLKCRREVADRDEHSMLTEALESEFERIRQRLVWLLTLVHSNEKMSIARSQFLAGSKSERALALELIENVLPRHVRDETFPMLQESMLQVAAERSTGRFKPTNESRTRSLKELIDRVSTDTASRWTTTCALYTMVSMPSQELIEATVTCLQSHDPLVRETAVWVLSCTAPDLLDTCRQVLNSEKNRHVLAALDRFAETSPAGASMLPTLDKIFILKSVSIFEQTSHERLAELCTATNDVALSAGERLFTEGDEGEADLFVIVTGAIQLHTGDTTVDTRRERELVGELAACDDAPREVSATALEKSVLLRIPCHLFRQFLLNDADMAQAVLRTFCQRLRTTTESNGGALRRD